MPSSIISNLYYTRNIIVIMNNLINTLYGKQGVYDICFGSYQLYVLLFAVDWSKESQHIPQSRVQKML